MKNYLARIFYIALIFFFLTFQVNAQSFDIWRYNKPTQEISLETRVLGPAGLTSFYERQSINAGLSLRLGQEFDSFFEGGLLFQANHGIGLGENSNTATMLKVAADLRFYPLGREEKFLRNQASFEPFVAPLIGIVGFHESFYAQSNLETENALLPYIGIGLGANYHFDERLGITSQVNFESSGMLGLSFGIRHRM